MILIFCITIKRPIIWNNGIKTTLKKGLTKALLTSPLQNLWQYHILSYVIYTLFHSLRIFDLTIDTKSTRILICL